MAGTRWETRPVVGEALDLSGVDNTWYGTNIKTREDDWRIAPKKGWTDLKRCLFPILVGLHFSICLILFRGSRSSFF